MPKKRGSHKNKKGQQSSAKHSPRNTKDENIKGPSTDPQGTPGDREKAWPMMDGATGCVDSRTNSSLQRNEDARRTVESPQRSTPPYQASNSSTSGSSQGQPKFYDIYLKFSQDTDDVHVHKVKDIIRRNDWTMMTAADSRLGVPKMTSIEDALKTCSHVIFIITKEDCEKDDPYQTMMMGMAFQSTVGRSLNGRVIPIRCCKESHLPLSLQSLENACIDDHSLEDKLKRTINVSIRKKKEGSSVAITAMRLEEEDVQRDSMAPLQKSSPLVDQPSADVEVQENWLENLPVLTELTLWKVSEVISPHRFMPLGLKLCLPRIKLKILLDESTISQQEEKTFKMLYQWYSDQVGDLSKFLFPVLTTDEGLDQEEVFNLFFEKQHTCTSFSGSSFQDLQLFKIAEELHLDKLIPLSLRLGMTYARICRIRKESNLRSVNVCYNVMMQWQKDQTAQIDQVETLARILEACRESRIAYNIRRKNHLGVTNEGKTLIISEDQPMEGVTEVQLNVTHSNQLVREEAQGKLQALLDVSLVPSTGVAADFLEGLKTFSILCKRHLDLVTCLERSIGRDGFYKLIGFTVDSIHFHVKVYTIEGLRWLQRDVQSGRIGHQLGKVLISEKTKQQVLEDIVLDVAPEGSGAWDLLSHAVIDPILPSTSRSTDFEKREALKEDRTSSSNLMAHQGHPVVPEATVRKQVVTQEEENSGLLAGSYPLETPGEVASVESHVRIRQEKCGPDDAVDKEKDSVTSTENAYRGEASKEMKDWTEEEVAIWLKSNVHLSDELVSKFEGVDGFMLVGYSKAELIEDFELSATYCRRLMLRREHYLEKEAMGMVTTPESASASSRQESLYQGYGIRVKESNSDTERKLTNLLLGSDKGELDSSYYPVLVVNTPAQQLSSAELDERFGFMSFVSWNVVFDCNADSNKMGLCQYVNQRKSIKILNADTFTETKDIDSLREGIDFPEIPVWVFPNGRNDVNVKGMDKMSDMDWMRERSHAVLNTVRFFSHPGVIPPGRAVVVFFLLSYSDIMVMTQLFREFYTSKSFQDLKRFTVIAENQGILHKWIQHLESQSIVSSKNMKDRCLGGVQWQEINTYMLRLLGSCETRLPELPMFPKGQCKLMKKHQSQWSDISILAKNECENTSMDESNPKFLDFVQEKESRFYQGHGIDWWNFYLSEERLNGGKGYNHVLKRQNYKRLYSDVHKVLNSQGKKVPHISMATVFHEAGSGGTTVAKNLLWDLHRQYRCAVVNRVTNDTVNQIVAFHKYGYEEGQKPGPVVLLLENLDSETMRPFLISLERETRYLENNGLTFVLIHCKRTSEPQRLQQKEESKLSVCVEHKLTEEENQWFTKKTENLEQRNVFSEKKSPERLLAFMVMKKECDPEYLKNVVKGILPRVDKESKKALLNAVNLLKYIAVVQMYNPGFAMPVSACDGFMHSRYRVIASGRQQTFGPWEKNRQPFLNLLLLEEFIQDINGCVKGLAIVHPVIATEIVEQLGECFQQKPADMILELLEKSTILDTLSYSKGYIQKVCRDLMVKRLKKEYGDDRETDFAPFIEDVFAKDRAKAFKIMEVGIRKFQDPFIAQQKARLHSKREDDFDNAEQAINIALSIVSKNSYLWDTKGIILRQKMTQYERSVDQEVISDCEMKELLDTFTESCRAFQNAQKAMEEETRKRNYAGFVGEITTIAKFLEIVQKRVRPFCFRNKGLETLRRYLMTDYIPPELALPSLFEFSDTMKSLSERVDELLGRFTDYLAHCAQQRFGGASYRIYDDKLEKIYTARHRFFALSSPHREDVRVHAQYPVQTAYAMRRSEVKRMNADGYQQIFDMASKKKVADLKQVQFLLRQNLSSPSPFDIRNFVFTLFALSVCSNEGLDEEEARNSVNILKMMEEKDDGFYGLFFEMLLNWPDGTPREGSTPIRETIRQLNARWTSRYRNKVYAESRHDLPKRSRIHQNYSPPKPSTEFYLGLQSKKSQFVHRKSIGRVTYDIWKEDSIKKRLRRLDGVLDSKDRVLYNPDGEEPVKITLSLPIKGLPSQEPVQFYLGFSFAGPLAYDVVYNDNRETPFIAKESSTNYPSYVNEIDDIDEGPVSYDF